MKTKYILLINLFLCLAIAGCKDGWDEYYNKKDDKSETNATENLLTYIKNHSEYSKFVQLLEETGIAQELGKDQPLTVWVPANNVLEDVSQMNAADKKAFVLNHINYLALYETKLKSDKIVKTITGKNLIIKEIAENIFTIDGRQITKPNQVCSNGVLHEIDGSLKPRKNIYDYIVESGPEYSTYRDSLLAQNDTIFVPNKSFPIGIDELGNTIYDSVFVIENPYFLRGDIRSEDIDFTLLMPTNQAIKNMWNQMNAVFTSSGKILTEEDSVKFFRWVMQATIIEDKIENYATAGNIRSVFNNELRTNYQLVDPGYVTCSNGVIYSFTGIHIPKFLYLQDILVETYEISEAKHGLKRGDIFTDPDAFWDVYANDANGIRSATACGYQNYADGGGTRYMYVSHSSLQPIFEFKTVTKNVANQLIEAKIMPGKYKLSARFRAYLAYNVDLFFNGEKVMTYNSNLAATNLKEGVILDYYEIPDSWGFNSIKVKIADSGNAKRIMLGSLRFTPLEDNY